MALNRDGHSAGGRVGHDVGDQKAQMVSNKAIHLAMLNLTLVASLTYVDHDDSVES